MGRSFHRTGIVHVFSSFCRLAAGSAIRALVWIAALLSALPLAAHAAPPCVHEVSMVFTESAPRDRFEIRNDSSAGQRIQRLTLDLSPSAGKLIFDTIEGGTGVEVFQPFRIEPGEAQLKGSPVVQDGSDRLTLDFTPVRARPALPFFHRRRRPIDRVGPGSDPGVGS